MKTIFKALIVISEILFISKGYGQAPNWAWAKGIGGLADDYGLSITIDAQGNTYATGFFRDTVDFDPGPGVFNLISAGVSNIFILKLDPLGNFVWVKHLPGTSYSGGGAITLDEYNNIYISGGFNHTVDFDPGPGVFNITAAVNSSDAFICKLDNTGSFIWAKAFQGTDFITIWSITLDHLGGIYTSGNFTETEDFDPGINNYNITSAGSSDIFISKLDTSGNFVWAKSMGGVSGERGTSIVTDNQGNVYATGLFHETVDFNPGTNTFNLTAPVFDANAFILKLNSSGNFIWAKSIGGINQAVGNAITLDNSGNILIAGNFADTVDFDPDASTTFNLIEFGAVDIFVWKLDSSGDFIWAKQMGGNDYDNAKYISVDGTGNLYCTGFYSDSSDFDPGTGTFYLNAVISRDIFVLKLDSSGNFIWAKSLNGTDVEEGNCVIPNSTGQVYLIGIFYCPIISFDSYTIQNTDSTSTTADSIIAKLDAVTGIQESFISAANIVISPNPSTTTVTITSTLQHPNALTLHDITGRTLLQQTFNGSTQIDVSNLARGMYIAEVRDKNGNSVNGKLLKE